MLKRSILLSLAISLAPHTAMAEPGDGAVPDAQPTLPLMNSDAWAFAANEDLAIAKHDLTNLTCPYELDGDYQLTRLAQFELGGEDVSCSYARRDNGAYLTFYMSWYGNPSTAKAFSESTIETLTAAKPIGKRLEEQASTIQTDGFEGDCYEVSHELNYEEQKQTTGVKHCRLGGWMLKTRLTYPATEPNPVSSTDDFMNQQAGMLEYVSACSALTPVSEDAAIIDPAAEGSLAIMLGLLAGKSAANDPELTDNVAQVTQDVDISRSCIFYSVDTDAKTANYLFTKAQANKAIPYSIYTSNVFNRQEEPEIWLETSALFAAILAPDSQSESSSYALWETDADGTKAVFRLYNSLPSQSQFIKDSVSVINNELPALSSVSFDENGTSTINLVVPE